MIDEKQRTETRKILRELSREPMASRLNASGVATRGIVQTIVRQIDPMYSIGEQVADIFGAADIFG